MPSKATLLNDLNVMVGRTDLSVDPVASMILRIAQGILNRRVRLRAQEKRGTLTVEGRYTSLPEDFLSFRSINIDNAIDREITMMTPKRIRDSGLWLGQRSLATEEPKYGYSLEGDEIVVAPEPTPESPMILDIVYFAKLPALVGNVTENRLLEEHYDIYFFACLEAAAIYLEDMEMAQLYESKMTRALDDLRKNERQGRMSGSIMRPTGGVRRVV